MITLWIMNTEKEKVRIADYLSVLTRQEKEKALRFRFEDDRTRSILGAYLIHKAFEEDFPNKEYALEQNCNGKPYYPKSLMATKESYFNLSHSGNLVVLARSNCDLGVDVEQIRDIKINNFHRILTDDEKEAIKSSDNSINAFLELWTKKEAFVKATGKGICALDKYETEAGKYFIKSFNFENHIISVCSKEYFDHIDIIEF